MTFRIYTLGCKVNSYESEALRERLLKQGYEEAEGEEADLYFVNTCAVTNEAERKDLQKVRHIARHNPGKPIFVMGCSSQLHKEEYLNIESVKAVVGNSEKDRIETFLQSDTRDHVNPDSRHFEYQDTPIRFGEKNVKGYVKVQDGCDNFCSYCVVPFTRGKSRSRLASSVLEESKALLADGCRELIIGGIDTGSYTDPSNPDYHLVDLLQDMLSLAPFPYRIRVSSIEASQVSDEYIALFRDHQDILCPHFHLPLQSGSQHVLSRMNRKYSLDDFYALTERLKKEIPGIALSADVITGFPGETEEDFEASYQFCKKIGFMRIHAFPYSERPFTMAAKLSSPVPIRVRMDRVKRLMALSEENDALFRRQNSGKTESVLIEEKDKNGNYVGYSEHYLRFSLKSDENLIGTFKSVILD